MSTGKLCLEHIRPVIDAVEVLSGKWRIPVVVALCESPRRFNELMRDIKNITPRMLAKTLQELEQHELLEKIPDTDNPATIIYQISEYGHTMEPLILALTEWGTAHRKRLIGKS
ncbi:helix-turn-helix domain-containing protein [Chitinophaga sp. HK235]|uniref:winged helix-turn-helix transcriptional regulator n=1 Tax=Chitinophaga sp. HK235 TaxID=2952571 RepID=UPI001BA590AC|nr:helix-turn-helix domain-containing protein [Chitinophaga sp. HK235]